jgi:polyferredoxin
VTRTRPSLLLLLAALGAGAGWFLETALVSAGSPAYVPPFTLAVVLALIGVIVVLIARPVYRAVRRTSKTRVDPFYATRAVVLAKASSLTGSLFGGVVVGVLVFLLTRSVVPAGSAIAMTVVTVVASIVLLAGGLIAEKMCTLPPQDDDPTQLPASQDHA